MGTWGWGLQSAWDRPAAESLGKQDVVTRVTPRGMRCRDTDAKRLQPYHLILRMLENTKGHLVQGLAPGAPQQQPAVPSPRRSSPAAHALQRRDAAGEYSQATGDPHLPLPEARQSNLSHPRGQRNASKTQPRGLG